MLTLARTWSRKQKWLIVTAGLLACVLAASVIYTYERHFRGPDESILYGTWLDPLSDSDNPFYIEFRPEQKFWVCAIISGKKEPLVEGSWYAGGQHIYMRYPADFSGPSRPTVMFIVDISPEDIAVQFDRGGRVFHYRRAYLDAPNASNQAMQRTAGRSASPLCVASNVSSQPRTLSPAVADLVSR
jgi:hypothetical protein